MRLTNENANKIHLGDVVRFKYQNGKTNVGVVYGHPSQGDWGLLCNRDDQTYFGHGPDMFDGSIEFEILEEHKPVALFGMGYDFVCNHA